MSDEDEQKSKQAKECHICGKSYTQKDIRVRDHCHITGQLIKMVMTITSDLRLMKSKYQVSSII